MALKFLDNAVIEQATCLAFYENLFPQLKHIEGKGVNQKFLAEGDPTRANSIDIPRVLPIKPHYRTLGASNNGSWKNEENRKGGKVIESTFYTVALNHVFDEAQSLPYTLISSNAVDFSNAVNSILTDSFAQTLNAFTWASQLYKFFQDNAKVDDAVFYYSGSNASSVFTDANASLSEGDLSIGAAAIPADKRQAFISNSYNSALKSQYSTNAADLAVMINSTGFINPFSQNEDRRVDTRTGLAGIYDGVVMTTITKNEMGYVEEILGAGDTEKALLDAICGIIVYGDATIRGVVGPSIQVKEDPAQYATKIFTPYAKFGVGVLSGKTIKLITSTKYTDANLTTLKGLKIADGLSSVGDGSTYSSQSVQ